MTGYQFSSARLLVLLGVLVGSIGVIFMLSAIWFGLTSTWSRTDVIAAMGVIIGVGTFLLAVIGAVVAVAAYGLATQAPDLEPQIIFPGSEPNAPVLIADPSQTQSGVFSKFVRKQLLARVRIHNRSGFPGRNPSFRIQLLNLRVLAPRQSRGVFVAPRAGEQWEITERDASGIAAYQWDSAGTFSAHANWPTYLPNLDLDGLMAVGHDTPQIVLEVTAEGVNKPVRKTVTIQTILPQDWFASHPDLKGVLPRNLQLAVDPDNDPI